jgi:hypothetical protein
MSRTLILSLAFALVASQQASAGSSLRCILMSEEGAQRMASFIAQLSGGDPAPMPEPAPEIDLPVGKWTVTFSNGVTEVCEITKGSAISVVEPVEIPGHKAAATGNSVVVTFDNGRVQRWTPVGKRLVVEHWFPGSPLRMATAEPAEVLGIAERAE